MGLIPARDREQGLPPRNQFERLDRLVPQSRAPTDVDSSTLEPYVPSPEDASRQRIEQPLIDYAPDGKDAERRQAVEDYERRRE
jgi:hypothetical protein